MAKQTSKSVDGLAENGPGSDQNGEEARKGRRKPRTAGHAEPAAPGGPVTPVVLPEADDTIRVGAGGKLVVPREAPDDLGDDGEELDLASALVKKVRKPNRREWIVLRRDSELPTRLLLHKPKADGIEVEHYYVDRKLRGPIRDELKEVRVFQFYSVTARAHALWVVNVNPDNSWYESLQQFLRQPAKFFEEKAFRVISDKDNSRYRVRHKDRRDESFNGTAAHVAWPSKSTDELLGEALGAGRFITSPDHPLYRDLTGGVELA
jgi:hypothetical protein